MTRLVARFFTVPLLLVAPMMGACSDLSSVDAVSARPVSVSMSAKPTARETIVVHPPSAEVAAAAGVYEIDTTATGRAAGFFGSLVVAAVKGSTLELRADASYVGMKAGKPQSEGTWRLEDGKLTLNQTREEGRAVADRGQGSIRDRRLEVTTKKRGITLFFRRR